MDQQNKKNALTRHLPSNRQLAIHFSAMMTLSCLLGPLIGPLFINWINPPQAWGAAARMGDYSLINVVLWGSALLMLAVFIYTGWLLTQ